MPHIKVDASLLDSNELSDELYARAEELLTPEVFALVDSAICGCLRLLAVNDPERLVAVHDRDTGKVQPGVLLFEMDMRVMIAGAVSLALAGAVDEVKGLLAAKGDSPVYTDDADPEREGN